MRRAALGVALLVLVAAGVAVYLHQGSATALLARKGQLTRVETTPVSGDARFTYADLTLHGSSQPIALDMLGHMPPEKPVEV